MVFSPYIHRSLPGVAKSDVTDNTLVFIDTAGLDVSELVTPDEESKGNEGVHVRTCVHIRNYTNLVWW